MVKREGLPAGGRGPGLPFVPPVISPIAATIPAVPRDGDHARGAA